MTGPFTAEQALRDEAVAIHGEKAARLLSDADNKGSIDGPRLAAALTELNSTALCLSGGGARSAAFSLGVIQALAAHPRPMQKGHVSAEYGTAGERGALLSQFHYLSTVAGGGYAGGWLTALLARAGYQAVWPKLVGRQHYPDGEPREIGWLRAYSNYLSSFERWTAIALGIRNLILNWLVFLPAVVLFLLAIKSLAVQGFWLTLLGFLPAITGRPDGRYIVLVFAFAGTLLLIYALRFSLRGRPSNFLGAARDEHRDSAGGMPTEVTFIRRFLSPALAAADLLAIYLILRSQLLQAWSLASLAAVTILAGVAIYALAWITAWPPKYRSTQRNEKEPHGYWLRDFYSWTCAGAVYGVLIGLGVYIVAHYDLWFILGNVNVPSATGHSIPSLAGYSLIALIYGVPWMLTAQLAAEMVFVGLTTWQPHSDVDRGWFGRSSGSLMVTALIWLAMMFTILLFWDVQTIISHGFSESVNKYFYGLGAAVGGAALAYFGKGPGSGIGSAPSDQVRSVLDWLTGWVKWSLPVTTWLFFTLLAIAISAGLDRLLLDTSLIYSSLLAARPSTERFRDLTWFVIAFAATSSVAVVLWSRVNVNSFSLQTIYRDRLVRAYLGAANPARNPNPITGADHGDDVLMTQLRPVAGQWQPLHVINISLNLTSSRRIGWQEREVQSFTVTPLQCGTAELGYRSTSEYGDADRGGISLGTALAISGATASPNVGYNASPIVSSLLALFNMRLGSWLGNPGPAGDPDYYKSNGPRIAVLPFVTEIFGITTEDRHYLHLSDGRHFESLGLYEMIRRRCRCIIVVDANVDSDHTFSALGNAVRRIAIDLGVHIRFSGLQALKKRSKDGSILKAPYHAIGNIDYGTRSELTSDVETGYILYIKPGYHGTESVDIISHAAANAAFPHEDTRDKIFSEVQFETYRKLGFEIMDSVLSEAAEKIAQSNGGSLSALRLSDLVEALALPSAATVDVPQVIKTLDPVTVAELRKALTPAAEKPA